MEAGLAVEDPSVAATPVDSVLVGGAAEVGDALVQDLSVAVADELRI